MSKKEDKEKNFLEVTINEKQFRIMKYTGLIFLFIGLYFILSNLPLFSSAPINQNASLLLILITGLLTSVHCVGMCGGFVIAYSTKNTENSRMSRAKQHFLYNISRLASYTFFGILAGLIGSVFLLTSQFRGYLSIFAGVFMVLYGLSTFVPFLRRITTIRTPSLAKYTNNRGPVVFGLLSGLLPCGPLQAMLIYAAATGSAIQGGIAMLFFSLGTIPLMFGFGNILSFLTHNFVGRIMKVSAVVVMVLGLVTLNRGLLLSGYELPFLNLDFLSSTKGLSTVSAISGNFQEINMTTDNHRWNPDTFVVKKDIPVKLNIQVGKLSNSLMGIRVPQYGLSKDFTKDGENVTLQFTPKEMGKIVFTCPMGVNKGEIIVE